MRKRARIEKSKRLTREEWLGLALETLAQEGKAKFRIERLVESLGVTKGSFYWHFRDRDDFVRSLVDYWARFSTARIIEEVSPMWGDAKERLFAVMDIVTREDLGRHDLAIRAWATQEPEVARVVEKVDDQRLAFVRSLFAEIGFRGQELEARTRVFACFFSLELGLFARMSKNQRLEQLKFIHAFFTEARVL